jgi:hypothetical protein
MQDNKNSIIGFDRNNQPVYYSEIFKNRYSVWVRAVRLTPLGVAIFSACREYDHKLFMSLDEIMAGKLPEAGWGGLQ